MPQTNPQLRTNGLKVIQCLQHMLRGITAANGHFTDGVTVVDSDPRKWTFDADRGVRETATLVRVSLAGRKRLPGQVGDSRRWSQCLELTAASYLTREQDRNGVTLNQIMSWLAEDVEMACARDIDCRIAAAELNEVEGKWGPAGTFGGPPHCQNLRVDEVEETAVKHPVGWQVLVVHFEYDVHGPDNFAGTL